MNCGASVALRSLGGDFLISSHGQNREENERWTGVRDEEGQWYGIVESDAAPHFMTIWSEIASG